MSQAGIRPRDHPKQVRTRRSALDAVDDRRTPRDLFDRLHARYGFTLDAAASEGNALLPNFFDIERDGLRQSWTSETVWCNPPFSNIPAWVEKAFAEVAAGCLGAVLLLPADRTEQAWWQDNVEPRRDRGQGVATEFIRRRVKFGLPPGHPQGDAGLANGKSGGGYRYPPFGCVLLRLGNCADRLRPGEISAGQLRLLGAAK